MVDIAALLRGFLGNLKQQGVSVVRGRPLESVRAVRDGFEVQSGKERWSAKKLVNAAGAWAGWVAHRAGAMPVPLVAYRRHLFFTRPDAVSRKDWPFVWDLSHDFYFRPIGSRLMFSPCDKTPESRGDRSEKVHPLMERRLIEKLKGFSGALKDIRVVDARSGLRTMAPDGRFVLGEDPALKNFYWAAGLGGHGVTSCFSIGELSADIILGRATDGRLRRVQAPGRFQLQKDMAHVA